VVNDSPSSYAVNAEPQEQKEMQFDWEIAPSVQPQVELPVNEVVSENQKEEVVRFMLEDDSNDKISMESVNTRTVLSPEDQQRRTQERLSKIQEYTAKLKRAEGITEFENEPAFVRRNIELDHSVKSNEEPLGRFGIANDGSGPVLRSNNFLHDNVD
jgi:cell division protein FtsZ